MKNALFIGGTKGLGLELAHIAIMEGWTAAVLGRAPERCPLVQEGKAGGIALDLEHLVIPEHLDRYALIVWAAGRYQEPLGHFTSVDDSEFECLCRNHLIGPMQLLKALFVNRFSVHPVHLIAIGSTSAFTSREHEIVYDAMKAGKAQFVRGLGKELPYLFPGSKVTLAHPGGMNTPFWEGRNRDVSLFMDPAAVARVVWSEAMKQIKPFREFRVLRQSDRSPILEIGPVLQT